MSSGRRIILVPGMGADARLFEPQRALADVEIVVPPWLKPQRRESLASYGRRMAEGMDTSLPFVLGGVSLGGMIAWEAARHVPAEKLRGVLLMSTAQSNRGVPAAYRWAGRGMAAMPAFCFKAGKGLAPLARKFFGITTPIESRMFEAMLKDADPAFLKWSLGALLRWPGPRSAVDAPVSWIHGTGDRILPIRLARPTDRVVGAGHLMNVTHAAQVNAIISAWLNRLNFDEA